MKNKSSRKLPFLILIVAAGAAILYYSVFRKSVANFAINLDY